MSAVTPAQQLNFIQTKIRDIGSAIFFNLSDCILKLPTSVITQMEVDDYGYVWFEVKKPRQNIKEFETEFPVRLEFYKKGAGYFLQINGNGRVADGVDDLLTHPPLMEDTVLVKVKITKAEYFETVTQSSSWWRTTITTLSTWFKISNSFRPQVYYTA